MLVSIVIPTHGRARYARHAIAAALQVGRDAEVVVSDTSDIDELSGEFAAELELGRLTIIRPGANVSVVENFNAAIAVASGRYLICIGDDDLITPDVVSVAEWAEVNQVDALRFSFPVLYYWEDFTSNSRWRANGGTLNISPFNCEVSPFSGRQALLEATKNLGGGVLRMPRAYAGMISSHLKNRIVHAHGALFGGVSPDIYSAALIAQEASCCVLVDYPVVVPGASGASTSGQSASGGHKGDLRDNAHIAPFKNLIWDSRVPEFYSVPTVWGYSLLKAVERWPEVLAATNFGALYLRSLVAQPGRYKSVLTSMCEQASRRGWLELLFGFLSALGREVGSRIATRLAPKAKVETIVGLPTVSDARIALARYLSSSRQKINLRPLAVMMEKQS